MRPYQKKLQQRRKRISKKWVFIAIAIVVVVGIVSTLEATNTTHLFHKANTTLVTTPNVPSRTNTDTKGDAPNNNANKNAQSPTSEPSQVTKDKNSEPTDSNTPLKTPTGTFVSNHHPNLSGSPAPNQIQSVCVTTSGAQCQILFTKDGVTKSLPAQTTDRGGAAYWTWKLQDIGLTVGSWKVQAKATLGSQTQTADDAAALEVSQ